MFVRMYSLCKLFICAVFLCEKYSAIELSDSFCILEHFVGTWKEKAKLTFSISSIDYERLGSNALSADDLSYLENMANRDSLYKFRLKCLDSTQTQYEVQSYVKGCSLLHSGLREHLYVALGPTRHVKGIQSKLEADGNYCNPAVLNARTMPDEFFTKVDYTQQAPPPIPDTVSYIEKLETEKREKMMNPPDNRGFLQKYWMYILPAVVILLLNSQGSAGGR